MHSKPGGLMDSIWHKCPLATGQCRLKVERTTEPQSRQTTSRKRAGESYPLAVPTRLSYNVKTICRYSGLHRKHATGNERKTNCETNGRGQANVGPSSTGLLGPWPGRSCLLCTQQKRGLLSVGLFLGNRDWLSAWCTPRIKDSSPHTGEYLV